MGTPSLFPMFLKRGQAVNTVSGIVYLERFDVEVVDDIEVTILDETIAVEIIEQVDVEIADETIDVEIS
jgi:hypothetical protein